MICNKLGRQLRGCVEKIQECRSDVGIRATTSLQRCHMSL